jgi:adenylylsulfate kinase
MEVYSTSGAKMKRILIMGLPGSGKTTLATGLEAEIKKAGHSVMHLNADHMRNLHNDWNFSEEGRLRQAKRMDGYANISDADYTIMDFVCPLPAMRGIVRADYIIWMDTINKSRFEDTNKVFEPPLTFDLRIESFKDADADKIWKTNLISL